MAYEMEISETVPGTVFEMRRAIRSGRIGPDIGAALGEMFAKVEAAGLHPAGPPSVTYLDPVRSDPPMNVDLAVPVAPGTGHAEIGDGARIVGRHARPVARTVHHGDYAGIGEAYRALEDWTAGHGYRAAGPPTETYLVGPDATADPAGYRTEVRVPVIPSIGRTVHIGENVSSAAERTRQALVDAGFSVLWETDLSAVLRARLDADLEDYLVLGVCLPDLALRVLDADRQAGLLLPCTVAVRAADDGAFVEALDPGVLVRASGLPELSETADAVRKRLDAVLAAIREAAE